MTTAFALSAVSGPATATETEKALEQAHTAYNKGLYTQSILFYKKALALDPKNPKILETSLEDTIMLLI
jgi:hypothetical protein